MKHLLWLFLLIPCSISADEGVWFPNPDSLLLKRFKDAGLYLSAEDLYSDMKPSLKDVVVRYGNGCSGVMVSDKGLFLTNHHCGLRAIESCSTTENNYLDIGFWATPDKEIPVKGLSVHLLIDMQNVTVLMLMGIGENTDEETRKKVLEENRKQINKQYTESDRGIQGIVQPLYGGNEYWLYRYAAFKDVRLVGAPPTSIGKFGGSADNWEWPRHSGDFALFRIYADSSNQPATYSPENVPYSPVRFANISLSPVEKEDFCMVMGYPGSTNRYMLASEIESNVEESYPDRILLMENYLRILEKHMQEYPEYDLKNRARSASIHNELKKMKGTIAGFSFSDGIKQRKEQENLYRQKINSNESLMGKHGDLLNPMNDLFAEKTKYIQVYDYFRNGWSWSDLWAKTARLRDLLQAENPTEVDQFIQQVTHSLDTIHIKVDKEWLIRLIYAYKENVQQQYTIPLLEQNAERIEEFVNEIYDQTLFVDSLKLAVAYENGFTNLHTDLAVRFFHQVDSVYEEKVWCCLPDLSSSLRDLAAEYTAANLKIASLPIWPDANGTMRLSYGKVKDLTLGETVYPYFTTLKGLMDKHTSDPVIYAIPEKLRMLYDRQDYGEYAVNNEIPVCFIADCHTVGGNSGSPVFNKNGELIGLNFDRPKQGTISEFLYDPAVCRNIVADMHYILFIIDKYGEAKHLIDELIIKK